MNRPYIFFGTDNSPVDILVFSEIFQIRVIIEHDIAIVIDEIFQKPGVGPGKECYISKK
jgi:hypothetical protein